MLYPGLLLISIVDLNSISKSVRVTNFHANFLENATRKYLNGTHIVFKNYTE
jgi:hypothetical protein